MNKQRRTSIAKIAASLDNLRAEIETLMEEEQDYYDNMPESLQESERGQIADEAIGFLQSAIDCFDDIIDNLSSASGD
jgi:phage host-nuclease inhibitor protein Gam